MFGSIPSSRRPLLCRPKALVFGAPLLAIGRARRAISGFVAAPPDIRRQQIRNSRPVFAPAGKEQPMSCKSISLRRHVGLAGVSVAPLCLILERVRGRWWRKFPRGEHSAATDALAGTHVRRSEKLARLSGHAGRHLRRDRTAFTCASGWPELVAAGRAGRVHDEFVTPFQRRSVPICPDRPGTPIRECDVDHSQSALPVVELQRFAIESRSFANQPLGNYCCQFLGEHLTAFSKGAGGNETQILSYDLTRASTNQQPSGTNNNLLVSLD